MPVTRGQVIGVRSPCSLSPVTSLSATAAAQAVGGLAEAAGQDRGFVVFEGVRVGTPEAIEAVHHGGEGLEQRRPIVLADRLGEHCRLGEGAGPAVRGQGGLGLAGGDVGAGGVRPAAEPRVAARKLLGPVWRERMGQHYPAMALVGVSALVEPDAVVEIEAVAYIGGES